MYTAIVFSAAVALLVRRTLDTDYSDWPLVLRRRAAANTTRGGLTGLDRERETAVSVLWSFWDII